MCGRYARRATKKAIADWFGIDPDHLPESGPSFNIAPQTFQPVVRLSPESGAAAGLFPVPPPTVRTEGRDLTIALAAAGPHTLHVGLVWWTMGMVLATMYFCIVYWLFRGKVSTQLDGYGH